MHGVACARSVRRGFEPWQGSHRLYRGSDVQPDEMVTVKPSRARTWAEPTPPSTIIALFTVPPLITKEITKTHHLVVIREKFDGIVSDRRTNIFVIY